MAPIFGGKKADFTKLADTQTIPTIGRPSPWERKVGALLDDARAQREKGNTYDAKRSALSAIWLQIRNKVPQGEVFATASEFRLENNVSAIPEAAKVHKLLKLTISAIFSIAMLQTLLLGIYMSPISQQLGLPILDLSSQSANILFSTSIIIMAVTAVLSELYCRKKIRTHLNDKERASFKTTLSHAPTMMYGCSILFAVTSLLKTTEMTQTLLFIPSILLALSSEMQLFTPKIYENFFLNALASSESEKTDGEKAKNP